MKNNYIVEKRRMAIFTQFTKLFNIWLHRKKLDFISASAFKLLYCFD